jgi:putative endonuclease
MTARQEAGALGEQLVARRLESQGFQVLACNARVGRLELDVIAARGSLVVFCEVRTRNSRAFLDPIETIDRAKVGRVRKAAAQWLAGQQLRFDEIRFDAASVLLDGPEPQIDYFEAAF